MVVVAIAAFLAIFVVHVPFPLIVLARAGRALGRWLRPDLFEVGVVDELQEHERTAIADDGPGRSTRSPRRCARR